MFRVISTEVDGDLISEHHYTMNNTKDIWDLILGITGNEIEANHAQAIAANMFWNDKFESGSCNYRITCFRERGE